MDKFLGKEVNWLLKEKYSGKLSPALYKDIKRLKRGEPLDYVIGFTYFLGYRVDLSQKPLIPRPETEYWVEEAIEELRIKNGELRILDIFAGSGCIGIAILKHIKNAKVNFAEKDKRFLKQIEINLKLNHIDKKRYYLIQSDVFNNIKGKYDYIFANPPYISKKKLNKVQKSVLKFEPKSTIFGGKNGLFYIKRFLKNAKNYLKKDGEIYMELDSYQKGKIAKILKKFNYKNYQFHKDQYGKWRYLIVI